MQALVCGGAQDGAGVRGYLRRPERFTHQGTIAMCLKTLVAGGVLFVAAATAVVHAQATPNHHLSPDRLAEVRAMMAEAR